jgi:hypothetical protein
MTWLSKALVKTACRAWIRRMSSQAKVRADLASFPGGRSRSCGIVGMPNVGKVRPSLIARASGRPRGREAGSKSTA